MNKLDSFLSALAFLAAATTAAANGCGQGLPSGMARGKLSGNLMTPHSSRRHRIFIPEGYNEHAKTPVVLSFHGANGTIEKQVALDGMTDPFHNKKFIIVYMQALVPPGSDKTEWQVAPGAEGIDDVSFVTDVLISIRKQLCVDSQRIYATGKSQGGGFIGQTLACDPIVGREFAAFAPVSGAYYIPNMPRSVCEPTDHVTIPCATDRKDTAMMVFHGGADRTIPYRGIWRKGTNSCLPDVAHWTRMWVWRNGLQGGMHEANIPRSKHAKRIEWGDSGRVTLMYDGDNIGHDWPNTVDNPDNKVSRGPTAPFNATDIMLDWFQRFYLIDDYYK